jgi:hypothetical protein
MTTDGFYLGGVLDDSGERTSERVDYDPGDLTTHGVIVGMTGSGKTGLGIIYLEEALLAGIPALILDPKGDMTNLLLTFPELRPDDFAPWIDESAARSAGVSVAEMAASTADRWRKGLADWDQDGDRIRHLKDGAGFTIYTPGSTAGVPLNIVGSLDDPGLDWDTEAETLRDEIQGFVSGLLGLVGIDADPLSSREHILLSNLVEHAWRHGRSLDLATLLGWVQKPPLRKLGVFDLDTFFPEDDRTDLAMKLNGLVASPAFRAWTEGAAVDVEHLLWRDGTPQAAILYLAHLSDQERQFVVTMVLSKLVTWMRSQSGSGELRALVYMDEVYGFVPPTAEPPAKKPILTLLKQARAFGVGMLLATQNPVDLDYKAMSNAGTWCVGRLQTERDKARILEALQSARGDSDVGSLDRLVSGLDKRQFLLHNTRDETPTLFTTRWALSFLRGPLTRDQVGVLMEGVAVPEATGDAAPPPEAEPLADDESAVLPPVADGIQVAHLDPAAAWIDDVGGDPGSHRYQAAIAARVALTFDDAPTKLTHHEEWEAILSPIGANPDFAAARTVDYDTRDFTAAVPDDARYRLPEADISGAAFWRDARARLESYLDRERTLEIFKNSELKLASRVGETREEFAARCDAAAQEQADAEVAKLRDTYRKKVKRVQDRLATAEQRVADLEADLEGAHQQQVVDSASAVLGILLGRRSTRSITGSARSRRAARSKERRLATAEAKAADTSAEIDELETELRHELEQINDRWEAKGDAIEPVEVGLEKNDIDVVELLLLWIPVA